MVSTTRKILFPTDLSPESHAALEMATALARDRNATLLILHVDQPSLGFGGGEAFYVPPQITPEELSETLHQIVPDDSQVPYEHLIMVGDAADTIVRMADEQHVDLIVMGTHGRTGLARLLMGSVAESVVRRAPCPVLTVKQPVAAHAH